MATEGDDVHVHCNQDGGSTTTATDDDRISGLSDDLLHSILLRLNSTPEAARTSVLSRRWRRVWAALPELCLPYRHESPFSAEPVCRRISEALAACSAPAVRRLEIWLPLTWTHFPRHRVARWLRFASRRLAGELRLHMAPTRYDHDDDGRALVLPPCPRATAIRVDLSGNELRFEPAASSSSSSAAGSGAFTALRTLRIEHGRVGSRELEDAVSSRCPSLKELVLGHVHIIPYGASGLCVRSDSLERLEIFGGNMLRDRLEVAAPKLRSLKVAARVALQPWYSLPDDTRIVAPMLSELCWDGRYDYDPSCHRLEVGRHLQRLYVETNTSAMELMQLFDTIQELVLTVDIPEGMDEYRRFLKDRNDVTKCKVLIVTFIGEEHAHRPTMLYLLQKCTCIRKLELFWGSSDEESLSCPSCCPCRLSESWITDDIILDLLEEVEIHFDESESYELLGLIELLLKKALILKKIILSYDEASNVSLLSKNDVCKKVRSMCHPNIKVEFT